MGIGTSTPTEQLEVEGNLALNGALKGSARVYTTNLSEVTYTSASWSTNSSISLEAGTWMIFLTFEAKGWSVGQDYMQYRLYDASQTTQLFGTGTSDWLYIYYVTSDNFSLDYWFPISYNHIYTVPSGTSTINLDFYGDYDIKIQNVTIFALRIL